MVNLTVFQKIIGLSVIISTLPLVITAYISFNFISNNLKVLFFIISLLAIFISFGFSIYLSNTVLNPINKLYNLSKDLEKGNFESRLEIKRKDEFGRIATSFNRAMDSLENLEKQHKQIDKAKTEFLSITSHELRSPMTPMQAQLQMLLEGYDGKLNKKQRESLDIVLRNTKRLDKIIVDFLEVSRVEAGRLKFHFVKTSLANHLSRLVKEMDNFLPDKKINIKINMGKLPLMEVDPDRVMQVLRNLITNAKKFSPENSTITITASLYQDMIKFSVRDQGIGLSLDQQARVFTPFYQVENMYQRKSGGTGLGLSICRGIVEAQDGKIWLESQKNKGTTFYFTVPLKPVRETKPIKLLFSNKKNIEAKVKELYVEFLGPVGEMEFRSLGPNIDSSSIFDQIDNLLKENVIHKDVAIEFKHSINEVFKK